MGSFMSKLVASPPPSYCALPSDDGADANSDLDFHFDYGCNGSAAFAIDEDDDDDDGDDDGPRRAFAGSCALLPAPSATPRLAGPGGAALALCAAPSHAAPEGGPTPAAAGPVLSVLSTAVRPSLHALPR